MIIAEKEPVSYNSYVAVAAYDSDQCNFWDAKNCFVSVGRRSVSPVHYKHCRGTSWITFCGSITLGHVEMLNQISCGTASVFWSSTQWGVNMLHNCSGSRVIENTAVAQYQMSVRVTISCGEVQKEEYERSRFSTQRSTLRHTEPGPRQPLPAGPARVRQPL